MAPEDESSLTHFLAAREIVNAVYCSRRYDPDVNRFAARALGLIGLGALLSQAGHLVVYQLRYGTAAQAVQSTGVHAYFPIVAKTSLGLAASVVVGALLIIGLSRFVASRATAVAAGGPSYITLLASLFTIQVAFFGVQETTESLLAGMTAASAPQLLLLGAIGQLPVAALAAVALKWLFVRFEAALQLFRAAAAERLRPISVPRLVLLPHDLRLQPALANTCPAAYIKRGPPPNLRS